MPGVEALIYDHEFSDYEEEPPKRPHLVLIYSQDSNEFYEIQDENPDTEDSADVENEDIDAWDELEDYPQVKKMRLSSAEHSEALSSAQSGDKKGAAIIIECNHGLVVLLAKQYSF